jgi:hypothetical protein
MARPSSQIVLSAEGRRELERLARAPRTQSLLLAKALGDISDDEVWRVLRKFGISLQRRRSWCVSTDPEFAAGFRCSALNPCAEQASPQLKTSLPISRRSGSASSWCRNNASETPGALLHVGPPQPRCPGLNIFYKIFAIGAGIWCKRWSGSSAVNPP